ncbi:hypothetical protein [Enterobacter asburiae]
MKLIDFLISESKKGWEWPYSIVKATSTKGGRGVNFYFDYACPPSLSNTLIAPSPFSSSELVTREKYEAALAASKPEWDGEGLPPVGVEFEHSFRADGFSTWHWRRCTAVGKHGVLCVDDKDTELYLNDTNNRFRPIRSEADKKRDEAIADMVKRIGITPESAATCYDICTHID